MLLLLQRLFISITRLCFQRGMKPSFLIFRKDPTHTGGTEPPHQYVLSLGARHPLTPAPPSTTNLQYSTPTNISSSIGNPPYTKLIHCFPVGPLGLIGRNGSVPFLHTNRPFPSVSKRREAIFMEGTVAQRNGPVCAKQALPFFYYHTYFPHCPLVLKRSFLIPFSTT